MGGGGDGRLFEAGRLLTFSAFRMGAYSRWALIRGWALIRINTVISMQFAVFLCYSVQFCGVRTPLTPPSVTSFIRLYLKNIYIA